jgi:outer membrane lipoprotein-sorting protein
MIISMKSAICTCLLVPLLLIGCAFKSMHETVEDPIKSKEIEDQLKTQEDIDYWKKVKENNESAIIILNDP